MSDDITRQQSATEEKINEMVQQSRILEAYMNDIINREATITRLMEEARLASNAVQNIADESDIESLASVGIGVYMKALIPPVKKLLINLGAGVAIEKSREDTLNYIESKIREFEIALRQLVNQKQQIETRMEQIQNQINQMLKQAPAQSGSFRNHTSGQPQSH
ncbi:MAG TPA: prefoldin subunit alpha [Nitrososphaeraceae archaeon]|jgi:prefoldin alpha subunit|nr:prefoldin subunit alpha [Nitrososphaeraceae archaeon]